jgi:hypothetical protein
MGIFGRLIYHKTYSPSHFLPSCLQYIPFITCVIPHTPKQIQVVRPMPHTPVGTQLIITQETLSTPSGQRTPSKSQEPEEALSDHQSYVQPIDPVEIGPTFNSPAMCVIVSNAGTLHYSALGTFSTGNLQTQCWTSTIPIRCRSRHQCKNHQQSTKGRGL